jgi:hypothetical protein
MRSDKEKEVSAGLSGKSVPQRKAEREAVSRDSIFRETRRATYDNGARTEEAGILDRADFYQRVAVPFARGPFAKSRIQRAVGFQTFSASQPDRATDDTAMNRRLTEEIFLNVALLVCGQGGAQCVEARFTAASAR